MATPWVSRVDKIAQKTITFTNVAGGGAIGTVATFTVTNGVIITYGTALVMTTLVGASATISLGVVGNTAALIPVTTASLLIAGDFWQDTSPEVGVSPAILGQNISLNLILTIATANLTAGAIQFTFYYRPAASGGVMS